MAWLYAFIAFMVLIVLAHIVLYTGFGFVYKAKEAEALRDEYGVRVQPSIVYKVDAILALFIVLLDALLNMFYVLLMLDFRLSRLVVPVRRVNSRKILGFDTPAFNVWVPQLVTGRLCGYLADADEYRWRKNWACIVAIFLNTKDPGHIKGAYRPYRWMR